MVLSGGQAPGGHNVIVGIYDYIKKKHQHSQLFGFLAGPAGIYNGKYVELRDDTIKYFKNRGGFDMICSRDYLMTLLTISQAPVETRSRLQSSSKTPKSTAKPSSLMV